MSIDRLETQFKVHVVAVAVAAQNTQGDYSTCSKMLPISFILSLVLVELVWLSFLVHINAFILIERQSSCYYFKKKSFILSQNFL